MLEASPAESWPASITCFKALVNIGSAGKIRCGVSGYMLKGQPTHLLIPDLHIPDLHIPDLHIPDLHIPDLHIPDLHIYISLHCVCSKRN